MVNFNLLLIALLVAAAGGTVALLSLVVVQQELLVHRRPRIIMAFVLSFAVLSVLFDRGISALILCLVAGSSFFAVGLLFRTALFGNERVIAANRTPRPQPIRRWRLNGIETAKAMGLLAVLTAIILLARRSQQLHQPQKPGPSYLDLIENIESDID